MRYGHALLARGFSRQLGFNHFWTDVPPSPLRLWYRFSLAPSPPYRLGPESTYRLVYPPASPLRSYIDTWYGIIHPFSIAYASRPRLRTDQPDVDYPSVGNLGLSANMFLTRFSLLMPAFSLLIAPTNLAVDLRRSQNAPLLIDTFRCLSRSFGIELSPVLLSAQNH